MQKDIGRQALQLAALILSFNWKGLCSLSQAHNMLDRLALRMENLGCTNASEGISTLYLLCR